jgi:hypothetical protein
VCHQKNFAGQNQMQISNLSVAESDVTHSSGAFSSDGADLVGQRSQGHPDAAAEVEAEWQLSEGVVAQQCAECRRAVRGMQKLCPKKQSSNVHHDANQATDKRQY